MEERMLNIEEAAEYLGLSKGTTRKYANAGKIKSKKVNGRHRFFSAWLKEYQGEPVVSTMPEPKPEAERIADEAEAQGRTLQAQRDIALYKSQCLTIEEFDEKVNAFEAREKALEHKEEDIQDREGKVLEEEKRVKEGVVANQQAKDKLHQLGEEIVANLPQKAQHLLEEMKHIYELIYDIPLPIEPSRNLREVESTIGSMRASIKHSLQMAGEYGFIQRQEAKENRKKYGR